MQINEVELLWPVTAFQSLQLPVGGRIERGEGRRRNGGSPGPHARASEAVQTSLHVYTIARVADLSYIPYRYTVSRNLRISNAGVSFINGLDVILCWCCVFSVCDEVI